MIDAESLLGSWALEWAHEVDGDAVVNAAPFGSKPSGILHYLADGRMAALIAHEGRSPLAGGRRDASDAERLRAARSFMAYAGTYDIAGDVVIHHVEINSFPNDVGMDYVRLASLQGDVLQLATPPDLPADQRPMRLRWHRVA